MNELRDEIRVIHFDGKDWPLQGSFNTLADLEDEFGSLKNFLETRAIMRGGRVALASMLNDFLIKNNERKRYTPEEVGMLLPTKPDELNPLMEDIYALVRSCLVQQKEAEEEAEEEDGKKPETMHQTA